MPNHRHLAIVLAAALVIFGKLYASDPAETYRVRKEDSVVMFTITKWLVFREEGRFKYFSGVILYDRSHPEETYVELSAQAASIDSRNEGRDRALRSEEFFDAPKYPALLFQSLSASARGSDTILITGNLTIKGTTKRVIVPVRYLGGSRVKDVGELVGFETNFTINREDFGVAKGWGILSNEVSIHLLIGAMKSGERASK